MSSIYNIIKRIKNNDEQEDNYEYIIDKPSNFNKSRNIIPSTYTNDFEKIYQVIKSSYNCGEVKYNYEECKYDNLVQNYVQKGTIDTINTSGYSNVDFDDIPLACNIPSVLYNNCSPPANTILTGIEKDESKGFRLNTKGYYLYPDRDDIKLILKKSSDTDFDKNKATFFVEKKYENNETNYYIKNISNSKYIKPYISKNFYILTNSFSMTHDSYNERYNNNVKIYDDNDILLYEFNFYIERQNIDVSYNDPDFRIMIIDDKRIFKFNIISSTNNYILFPLNNEDIYQYDSNRERTLKSIKIDFLYEIKISKIILSTPITSTFIIKNISYYILNNGLYINEINGIKDKKVYLSDNYIDSNLITSGMNNILFNNSIYEYNFQKYLFFIAFNILQNNLIISVDWSKKEIILDNYLTNTINKNSRFIIEKNNESLQIYSDIIDTKIIPNHTISSISKDNKIIILYNNNTKLSHLSIDKGFNFNELPLPSSDIKNILISEDGNKIIAYTDKTLYIINSNNINQPPKIISYINTIKKIICSYDSNIIYVFCSDDINKYIIFCIYNNIINKEIYTLNSDILTCNITKSGRSFIIVPPKSKKFYITNDYGYIFKEFDLCDNYPTFDALKTPLLSAYNTNSCNMFGSFIYNIKFIDENNFYIISEKHKYIISVFLFGNISKLNKYNLDTEQNSVSIISSNTYDKYIFFIKNLNLNLYKKGNSYLKTILDFSISNINFNDNINFNVNNDGSEIVLISGNNIYYINTNLVDKDSSFYISYGLNYPSYNYNIQLSLNSSIKNVFNNNIYTLTSSDIVKNISNNIKITKTEIYINNVNKYNIINSNMYFTDIACSYNGQYIIACIYNGKLLISNNSGNIFSTFNDLNTTNRYWISVACSYNGQFMSACAFNGNIFTSNNYGISFSSNDFNFAKKWVQICMNEKGNVQFACSQDALFISYDYGLNWEQLTNDIINSAINNDIQKWSSVSISSSGQYMLATVYNGNIYISYNYGYNWSIYGVSNKECYEPIIYPNYTSNDYLGYKVSASSNNTSIINAFKEDSSFWSPSFTNSIIIIELPYKIFLTDINIVNLTSENVLVSVQGSNDNTNWFSLGSNLNLYSVVNSIISYKIFRITFSSSNIQIQRIKLIGKTDFITAGVLSQTGKWTSCNISSDGYIHYIGSENGLYTLDMISSFGKIVKVYSSVNINCNLYDKTNTLINTIQTFSNGIKTIILKETTDIGRIEILEQPSLNSYITIEDEKGKKCYNSSTFSIKVNIFPPIY